MSGRPYAEVIGDPIAHSKSPLIHNFWLGKLGIDAEYRACHVLVDELADYFARRRGDAAWRGCNVTIPHKVTVVDLLDKCDRRVREIGAANCVVPAQSGLLGSNTDIDGIAEAVRHDDGFGICLIGNGGAARAALWHFAQRSKGWFQHHHKRSVAIVARDRAKSEALLREFDLPGSAYRFADFARSLAGVSLIVNASSLGMRDQPPLPAKLISNLSSAYGDTLVFDMVYNPLETALLREARRHGFATSDGLKMLIGQAATAFERFFGAKAPREHDAELRALLTAP